MFIIIRPSPEHICILACLFNNGVIFLSPSLTNQEDSTVALVIMQMLPSRYNSTVSNSTLVVLQSLANSCCPSIRHVAQVVFKRMAISVSQVLGLQRCATMPVSTSNSWEHKIKSTPYPSSP